MQHDLISAKIQVESSEKTAADLEKENRELLLHKSKLESSLEDALLGKVKGQVPIESEEEELKVELEELESEPEAEEPEPEKKDDKQRVTQKN